MPKFPPLEGEKEILVLREKQLKNLRRDNKNASRDKADHGWRENGNIGNGGLEKLN